MFDQDFLDLDRLRTKNGTSSLGFHKFLWGTAFLPLRTLNMGSWTRSGPTLIGHTQAEQAHLTNAPETKS